MTHFKALENLAALVENLFDWGSFEAVPKDEREQLSDALLAVEQARD